MMANSKGSKKRILTSIRNNERNTSYKSSVRTAVKKVHSLVAAKAVATDIADALKQAQSLIDRAVCKDLYKKNKGARDFSRLVSLVTKAQA
ncbi:MAG: 30S ribosomal protein S20 [Candidatus Melainabacteria bacterium]|jgi:small subunit ribosomal protein S20|nr:30S ribosomal protein S20 [Candidatus Melainabacteria bacterium]